MQYEYDPNKSAANLEKHGIDFEEAQALWDDERRLEVPSLVDSDEPRYLVIGSVGGLCWTAVITCRGEAVRIISVRRARAYEVQRYEENNHR